MKDETDDGPMTSPGGDNRPDLAEKRSKASDERLGALLDRLPFGSASSAADDRKVASQDDELEDEAPFAEPQAVVLINLKRVDGTRAEVDPFRSWMIKDNGLDPVYLKAT